MRSGRRPRSDFHKFHKFHATEEEPWRPSSPSSTNSTPPEEASTASRLWPAAVVPDPPGAGQPQAAWGFMDHAGPRALRHECRPIGRVPADMASSVVGDAIPAPPPADVLVRARMDMAGMDAARSRQPAHQQRGCGATALPPRGRQAPGAAKPWRTGLGGATSDAADEKTTQHSFAGEVYRSPDACA